VLKKKRNLLHIHCNSKIKQLEITILNQQFSNPNTSVYFDIRIRYNSNENWVETFGGPQGSDDYTVLTFELNKLEWVTTRLGVALKHALFLGWWWQLQFWRGVAGSLVMLIFN